MILHMIICIHVLTISYNSSFTDCCTSTGAGKLIFTKVIELPSIKFLFNFMMTRDISIRTAYTEMEKLKIVMPPCFDINELANMSSANISNARNNIKAARKKLVHCLSSSNMAHPRPGQLLFDWQQDCKNYNNGGNIEACNFLNNTRNSINGLSLMAAFVLRHIMYEFDISLWQLPGLWAAFYFLIMHNKAYKQRYDDAIR